MTWRTEVDAEMDQERRAAMLYVRLGRRVLAAAAFAAFLFLTTAVAGQVQQALSRGEVVREIDDPHSGERWLLLRNAEHPAGPGRLVLAGTASPRAIEDFGKQLHAGSAPQLRAANPPVIRAGDRVIVEERSQEVVARFEALALGSAPIGAHLNVRLAIGNKVVRATAVDRSRAVFVDARESWR